MVTSSAVVGSSAINISGPLASASDHHTPDAAHPITDADRPEVDDGFVDADLFQQVYDPHSVQHHHANLGAIQCFHAAVSSMVQGFSDVIGS
jgi:hypothetical protein